MENKLSSNAIKSWIIARTIFLAILIAIYIIVTYIVPRLNISWVSNFVSSNNKIINIIFLVLIFISIVSAFIEPFFEYKQWSYKINEEEIVFREGIYFTKSVTIPIVRIQHIELKEGPINKNFNLASVSIGTAGGRFEIPNLDKDEVLKIIEFLREKINENVREELFS